MPRLRSGDAGTPDPIALLVLAVLSECPRHPYDIQRLIRERRKAFAAGKSRALYHAVDRLVGAGWIEPLETTREGRRPERTVYQITAHGREELQAALSDLLATPRPEFPLFSVAVGFAGYLAPAAVAVALQERSIALEGEIASMQTQLRGVLERLELPRLFLLEFELDLTLRRAELAWVESIIRDLGAGRLSWGPWPGGAEPPG